MPKYLSSTAFGGTAVAGVSPGQSVTVWSAETPVAGAGGVSASQQVAISMSQGTNSGIGVSGFFSAAPGAFEIDVQVADVDTDTAYQTIQNGNITTVDATNNTFHLDGPYVTAKFARLLMRSLANSVTVTADILQR